MDALRVENIAGGYGKLPIVQGVSIKAEPAQIVTIVGPNGAGKSTFLKIIAGVLHASEGSVRVKDRDVTNMTPNHIVREGLAYVPQERNVFPTLSVRENLEMGGFTLSGDLSKRISHLFDLFPDLRDAARRKAGTLSGGQRNMLAMARALMLDPKVMLLDEPTAGLSPLYTGVVWEKVHDIAKTGMAVVVVEQNVERAMDNSDWVYVLVTGRNRVEGTPADLRKLDLAAIFLGKEGGVTSKAQPGASEVS